MAADLEKKSHSTMQKPVIFFNSQLPEISKQQQLFRSSVLKMTDAFYP